MLWIFNDYDAGLSARAFAAALNAEGIASRDSGKGDVVCTNRATILREEVEGLVLQGLRHRLAHPYLIAGFAEEYRRALNETAADGNTERDEAKRDLAKVEKQICGILAAIEEGMYRASMKEKTAALDARKIAVRSFFADRPAAPALRLDPGVWDL